MNTRTPSTPTLGTAAPDTAGQRDDGPANAAAIDRARSLGAELAELVATPPEFVAALRAGLPGLGDGDYEVFQHRIAPGLGSSAGVRSGVQSTLRRSLEAGLTGVRPATILYLADALTREDVAEIRWLAIALLDRIVPDDPERAWQLMRRLARHACEWITVDLLANAYGLGILREPFRWAELEQLTYSPSRWERRLVGSTVATIPFVDRTAGRTPEVAARGLALVGELIGDAEPDVQKALSWALRNLTLVDATGVERFCREQAALAARTDDGHRAWVVRDTVAKLPSNAATELKQTLAGVRRRPNAPSTSRAAEAAAGFGTLPDPQTVAEPPLT